MEIRDRSDKQKSASNKADELRLLARQLNVLADELDEKSSPPTNIAQPMRYSFLKEEHLFDDNHLCIVAQSLYRLRNRRKKFFSSDIFAEPSWDMLLDLFINTVRGKAISTTSLCLASGTPATTALRWLTILEQKGFLEKYKTERDNRVTMIRMTNLGYSEMCRCLSEWLAANRETETRLRLGLI